MLTFLQMFAMIILKKGGMDMQWMAWIWLALLLVFIYTEVSTVTMVSLWFAVGSLVALVASLLDAELWLQVVLFVVVSGVMLAALRPVARKHFTPKLTRTNVDAVIGKEGIVSAKIDNVACVGTVKISGMEWSARSTGGEELAEGTRIRVDKIEGVKVFVSPVEQPAEAK